jgi:hypothetical protein
LARTHRIELKMKRKESLTNHARLYRQSQEITNKIFDDFLNIDLPFQTALLLMGFDEELVLSDLNKLKIARASTLNALEEKCKSLDPYYFIPILINTTSKFYVEKDPEKDNMLGVALKICIDFIWSNTYQNNTSTLKSYTLLTEAINLAFLYCTLDTIERLWEFQDFKEVIINKKGIRGNALFWLTIKDSVMLGRHEYKTLKDALKNIWFNPQTFYPIIENIAQGRITHPVNFFGSSFLSEIPFKDFDFWGKLWSRFKIFQLCLIELRQSSDDIANDLYNVCLLPELYFPFSTSNSPTDIQSKIFETFWQEAWHKQKLQKKNLFHLQGMIVERPVLRIYDNENVFATSVLLIQDSINSVLENYIHSPRGAHLYEKYFSKPFEDDVINMFRKYGFKAGEVTTTSLWINQNGNELFLSSKEMPGQIDLLAISEEEKVIIVADCKLLKFPYEKSNFRNLLKKIGDEDEEGFHYKLNKKTKWIKSCKNLNVNGYKVLKIIITNRFIPFNIFNRRIVLSFEQIHECLQNKVKVEEWSKYWAIKLYSDIM